MNDQWLTVSQAAQQLGISERQARRYAARLSPENREEGPDIPSEEAGRESVPRPARRPARLRLEAMREARDAATKRENPQPLREVLADAETRQTPDIKAGRGTDMTAKEPDTAPPEAGHATALSSTKPAEWEERVAEYRGEIQFLRGLVEQRDRDAAELRAALREALKAQPRQLMSGEPSSTKEEAPAEAPTAPHQIVTAPESSTKALRETRQVQRRRAVRGLLRALFGFVDE